MSEDKTWNFDRWAERYDQVVAKDTVHYYAQYEQVLAAVVTRAALGPGMRVLDIGTGTGALALRCLNQDAELIGLDPSTAMLEKAREKVGNNPRATFEQADNPFLQIPYPDETFDAVVSSYAYHHIPHRLRADSMREMVRVLKPGGRWVLGDLVFEDKATEQRALKELGWLEEEYFTRIDTLGKIFSELGMTLHAEQFTPVTWVVWGVRPARLDGGETK